MPLSNFERMVQLADEVFAVKSDPCQLDVNQEVIDRLKLMHPATVSEYDDGNGPAAWFLVIPTTADFVEKSIVSYEVSKWFQNPAFFKLRKLVTVYFS